MDKLKRLKESTGERLEFYAFSDVTIEHLHRYAIALEFVKNKKVLDIASGEGYGSFLLSKQASFVYGVDIDEESIVEAKEKYQENNLIYLVGSTSNIPLEKNSIDVVVSFETIEHHNHHDQMFLEIKRVLKEDGILIMSSPDKKYYSDLTGLINKFHVKELYFEEFKSLSKKYFLNTDFYCQKAYNLNSYIDYRDSFTDFKVFTGDNLYIEKADIEPVYNIVIASSKELKRINASLFDGSQISKKIKYSIEWNAKNLMKKTNSYKIGNFIIKPYFIFKSKLKKILNFY